MFLIITSPLLLYDDEDDEYVEYYDDVGGGKARSKQAGKRSDKPKGKIQGK